MALNHLWGLEFSVEQLAEIGLQLGADVPVFVRGNAAWAEGVGEQLTDNAETLLKQSVGWYVPVSGFRYWVRGLQEPGVDVANQQFDELGRITEMQQADWSISIKRYMDVDGVDLPAKIFMHNDHVKLKLIIQTWDTTP